MDALSFVEADALRLADSALLLAEILADAATALLEADSLTDFNSLSSLLMLLKLLETLVNSLLFLL